MNFIASRRLVTRQKKSLPFLKSFPMCDQVGKELSNYLRNGSGVNEGV